ncbi:MAG: hypothetical protein LUC22_00040 [Prevotella sp.]|nr:hypothetical protein [Prevotella sp.]
MLDLATSFNPGYTFAPVTETTGAIDRRRMTAVNSEEYGTDEKEKRKCRANKSKAKLV